MTKLEEIARALCQQDEQNGGAPWDFEMGGDPKWKRRRHERYFESARAAVEAMPFAGVTREQLETVAFGWGGHGEGGYPGNKAVFNSMIDAILNEKPE